MTTSGLSAVVQEAYEWRAVARRTQHCRMSSVPIPATVAGSTKTTPAAAGNRQCSACLFEYVGVAESAGSADLSWANEVPTARSRMTETAQHCGRARTKKYIEPVNLAEMTGGTHCDGFDGAVHRWREASGVQSRRNCGCALCWGCESEDTFRVVGRSTHPDSDLQRHVP